MSTKLDLKYNNTLITSLTPENNEVILSTAGKYCANDINAEMNIDWYEGEVISSISVTTPPTKTIYIEGETLDLTGIVVKDNLGNDVTSQCTFIPANGAVLTPSDVNINISYLGLTCIQAITVAAAYAGLCFTANTAGSTVSLIKNGSPSIANTAYSRDGSTWISYTPGTTGAITLVNIGDKVYFRNDITGNFSTSNYLKFVITGSIAASGNCNSIYSAENFESLTTLTYQYCFCYLFNSCTGLTSIPALPATTLSIDCYFYMFTGCTGLTTLPANLLPTTTLTNYCYSYMFQGCTGLTTLPANLLPATTLASSCYYGMFYGCTGITSMSEDLLQATTLANSCYRYMFQGCTGLTSIPKLPATTLANYCYRDMFRGCTALKLSITQTGNYQIPYRIPTTGTGTASTGSLNYMFTGTGGTFTGTPTINTTYYLWDYNL